MVRVADCNRLIVREAKLPASIVTLSLIESFRKFFKFLTASWQFRAIYHVSVAANGESRRLC